MSLRAIARLAARERLSLWLAFTAVALIVLPKTAAALTGVIAAAVGAVIIALGGLASSRTPRPRWSLVAVLVLPALALTLSAATAVNASVALVGAVGQRAGAVTWMAAAALGVAVLLTLQPGDAGRLVRAVSLFCGLAVASATAEWAGLFSVARGGAPAAGVLENSLSAGQVLVLGVFASAAWAIGSRRSVERWIAIVCALVIVAGLWRIHSAGAWVGLGVGILGAIAAQLLARGGRMRAVHGGILVVVVCAALVIGMVAVLGSASPGALERWASGIASDRMPIWRSAVASASQSPIIGIGPEHFTSFVRWSSDPAVGVDYVQTADPHNLLLYLLVCGGVLGLGISVMAAGHLVRAMLEPLERGPSVLRAVLIGGVASWATAAMFAWVSPLALSIAAAMTAAIVADPGAPAHAGQGWGRRFGAAAAALAAVLVLGVLAITGATFEYGWADAVDAGSRASTGFLLDAAHASGDPAYTSVLGSIGLEDARAGVVGVASDPQYGAVADALERDSVWHVGLAMTRFDLEMHRLAQSPGEGWDSAASALTAGKRADAQTGLWDYYAAVYATSLGFEAEAEEHAQFALEHELPDNVRAYLIGTFGPPE